MYLLYKVGVVLYTFPDLLMCIVCLRLMLDASALQIPFYITVHPKSQTYTATKKKLKETGHTYHQNKI